MNFVENPRRAIVIIATHKNMPRLIFTWMQIGDWSDQFWLCAWRINYDEIRQRYSTRRRGPRYSWTSAIAGSRVTKSSPTHYNENERSKQRKLSSRKTIRRVRTVFAKMSPFVPGPVSLHEISRTNKTEQLNTGTARTVYGRACATKRTTTQVTATTVLLIYGRRREIRKNELRKGDVVHPRAPARWKGAVVPRGNSEKLLFNGQ